MLLPMPCQHTAFCTERRLLKKRNGIQSSWSFRRGRKNREKASATNSRLFTALCEEVDDDYHTLLMHTDMRWLSRGWVPMRLFSLREELHNFLEDKRPDLAEFFDNEKCLLNSATLQTYSLKWTSWTEQCKVPQTLWCSMNEQRLLK